MLDHFGSIKYNFKLEQRKFKLVSQSPSTALDAPNAQWPPGAKNIACFVPARFARLLFEILINPYDGMDTNWYPQPIDVWKTSDSGYFNAIFENET